MNLNKKYLLIVFLLLFSFMTVSSASAWVCDGDFYITDQAKLDAFSSDNCTLINGSLVIDSPTLTNLFGLETLETIVWDLQIKNNPDLIDLNGLINLETVGWNLWIYENTVLSSIAGLSSLDRVTGDIININGNSALTELDPLHGVSFNNYGWLRIYFNQELDMSEAVALDTQLRINGFNGTTDIRSNGDIDTDGDGSLDSEDNCMYNCNTQQADADNDGVGDVCDPTPGCGGCGGASCESEC
jgi:hypothetical protein